MGFFVVVVPEIVEVGVNFHYKENSLKLFFRSLAVFEAPGQDVYQNPLGQGLDILPKFHPTVAQTHKITMIADVEVQKGQEDEEDADHEHDGRGGQHEAELPLHRVPQLLLPLLPPFLLPRIPETEASF